MEEITITIKSLMWAGGVIITFGGVATVISRFRKPSKEVKEKVEIHEEKINSMEESNKVICKCMLALLDHEITGNSVVKLKTARKELQDYLIER